MWTLLSAYKRNDATYDRMPRKNMSYQVALKLSFCSAATDVLGMWPRPFRKLLGEHLSPGITFIWRNNDGNKESREKLDLILPTKKCRVLTFWLEFSVTMARAIYTVLSTGCWRPSPNHHTVCCGNIFRHEDFEILWLRLYPDHSANRCRSAEHLKETGLK